MTVASPITPEKLHADEQPVAEYQSVSRLAVASFGVGIVSAVAILTPLLAPVAIAACILGGLALRSIAASRGQLVGQRLALAGICLAMLFLGWGFARHFGRQATVVARARLAAETFLDLVQQGKHREALQFRQAPSLRIRSPEALKEHYEKNNEAIQELKGFAANQGIKDLTALGKRANLQFDGVSSAAHEGFFDRLVLRYTYDRPDGSGRQRLWVHVNRQTDEKTRHGDWQVSAAEINPPFGSAE